MVLSILCLIPWYMRISGWWWKWILNLAFPELILYLRPPGALKFSTRGVGSILTLLPLPICYLNVYILLSNSMYFLLFSTASMLSTLSFFLIVYLGNTPYSPLFTPLSLLRGSWSENGKFHKFWKFGILCNDESWMRDFRITIGKKCTYIDIQKYICTYISSSFQNELVPLEFSFAKLYFVFKTIDHFNQALKRIKQGMRGTSVGQGGWGRRQQKKRPLTLLIGVICPKSRS